jgi:hypothetical protein
MTKSDATEKGVRFEVAEFTESRRDGLYLNGVTLTTPEPAVFLHRSAPGGERLVPAVGGWSLTGLFSAIRLVELSLALRLNAAGYRELYAAYGHLAQAGDGPLPTQAVRYSGTLVLPGSEVESIAKLLNPAGSRPEQLVEAMRLRAELIQELDLWELREVELLQP